MYVCSEPGKIFPHFALNIPTYTHFSSPIRRYSDLVVHRLLNAALGFTEKPAWSPSYVHLYVLFIYNFISDFLIIKKIVILSCFYFL